MLLNHWQTLIMCEYTSSTSTNAKQMASNLQITGSDEQVEGKPSPSDLPLDAQPPPEAANEPPSISTEPQEKEKVKKTKNNKGSKSEAPQGNPAPESSSPADGLDIPVPLLNKRNSFRQQYAKLPTNLPMRSASCAILWDSCSARQLAKMCHAGVMLKISLRFNHRRQKSTF